MDKNKQVDKQGIHFLIDKDVYQEWRKGLDKRCMQQTGLLNKWIREQLEEWKAEEEERK